MLYRRIGYGAVLLAAVLFQIIFVGYLSTFLLVLVILLPFFSLALSLPGLLGCALSLSAEPSRLHRGGEGAFVLTLTNRSRLPLSRVTVRLTMVNQLTGARTAVRREFRGASRGAVLREEVPAVHCGQVICTPEKARICDLLGLFSLPVRCPAPTALLVLPAVLEPEAPPELVGGEQAGTALKPRPGGGPGEDYDLRDYRAGDPLRSIHWKLSSKRDELVVRETLEPDRAALLLTFDHFGPPEELDRVFDRLYALSRGLLRQERPHQIQWVDPETGAVCGRAVERERDLLACLELAFSTPAPLAGKSILDAALRIPGGGAVRHLHVAPGGERGAA